MKHFNMNAISNDEYLYLKSSRWRARHDLRFLCNEILDFPDVSDEIHGPMISKLQKFPKVLPYIKGANGSSQKNPIFWESDDISKGYINYKPLIPLTSLPGDRRLLILDFRGSLKTTINCTAHVMQWIINYPNIAILVCQSTLDKAKDILKVIKQKFQYSDKFRKLFPEHVPQKRIEDWGTLERFTTEARAKDYARREETCHAAGIDKGLAGMHFDILKLSDVVEATNTKTLTACQQTIKDYNLIENCLVSPLYWIDVEGTRYSHADLYGYIVDEEIKYRRDTGKKMWNMYTRAVYKKDTKGRPYQFTPDELDLPDLIDPEKINLDIHVDMKKISWWPERFSTEYLAHKKRVAPFEFASQQSLRPMASEEGMEAFPMTEKLPVWMKREDFEKHVLVNYYDISIDTAETDTQRADYSAIVVGAWSQEGYLYIVDIFHGKVLGDALIDQIFLMYDKYSKLGRVHSIKMENVGYNRGLQTGLSREMTKRNIFLPIEIVKRENQQAKTDRIIKTLQPFYVNGDLRFLHDLPAKEYMLEEMRKIPSAPHDDILDAMSDLFQNKEYFGKEYTGIPTSQVQVTYQKYYQALFNQHLGIEPINSGYDLNQPMGFWDKTGGL